MSFLSIIVDSAVHSINDDLDALKRWWLRCPYPKAPKPNVVEQVVKPVVNLVQNKTKIPSPVDHEHKASGSFSPLAQFCVSFVISLLCFYLLLLIYRLRYGCPQSSVSNPSNVAHSEQKSKLSSVSTESKSVKGKSNKGKKKKKKRTSK